MSDARYACHGLGVVQPIDIVALDLDRQTPNEAPFQIVGGFDPPVEQASIETRMANDHAMGRSFVWIGHSMGAALGFYLAQKYVRWHFRLIITVDPMNWASNITCANWQANPPRPGWWKPEGNYDRWINIHSNASPGGGIMVSFDKRGENHHFPLAPHIGIIELPDVRAIIDPAVRLAAESPAPMSQRFVSKPAIKPATGEPPTGAGEDKPIK